MCIDDEKLVARPIHLLHGTADNFNPIEPSREYAQRIQRAGGQIELHEFPGAHHVFDGPLLAQPIVLEGVMSNKGSLLDEREPGLIVVRGAGATQSNAEPRFEVGPTLHYDAAAFEASRALVSGLLRDVLRAGR